MIVYVDIDRFEIPDSANIAMLILGLVDAVARAAPGQANIVLLDVGARTAAAGGVLLLVRELYWRARGQHGLGLGDVKLAAAAGACLDWPTLPVALQVAAFLALGTVGVAALYKRQLPHRHLPLPFGACLAPSIWMAYVWERI